MTVSREWIEWYVWNRVRVRIRMERDKAKILDFVVQLELNDDDWKPVVRYNYAHGVPHRDLIKRDGKKEKLWLHDKTLKEVVDYAKKDLMKN